MSRRAQCPSCGGPIEFKLGSSWSVVCPFCRFSVMRTQTELRSLGKVSDLVPTAPDLTVGHRIYVGEHELVVGGRMQLDHGRGPWDEYYVVDGRTQRWGWLSKAQGRWTLTFAVQLEGAVPPWQQMTPSRQGPLLPGVPGIWTVAERGQSKMLSAEGELPFPIVPNMQGWYVDLVGPGGRFATVDYGDGSGPPTAFVGQELPEGAIRLDAPGNAPGMVPAVKQKVEAERLRCPRCGAPVPIQIPESTERAACGSCHALLDYSQGQLRFLKDVEQARLGTLIPLGREGMIMGESVICIAYLERETWVGNENFVWREFLLYAPDRGYRWLMMDNGHWTWMKPVSAGELKTGWDGVEHMGKRFRAFNRGTARVCHVLGEVYWKVEVGETVDVADYINPPQMLSSEKSGNEVVWSAGMYVEPGEVWSGFKLEGRPPAKIGVGFCQPNHWSMKRNSLIGGALLLALLALFFVFEVAPSHPAVVSRLPLPVPPLASNTPSPQHVVRTPPFDVPDGPTTLEVALDTNAQNQYVGVNAALLNTTTGEVHDFYVDAGYFSGYDGENWSEGSQAEKAYVDEVPAGSYVMELQPTWERFPQPGGPAGLAAPQAQVSVTLGKRSPWGFGGAFFLLFLPIIVTKLGYDAFEKRRAENGSE